MTVYYETENRAGILFSLVGSAWHDVFRLCAMNSAITILIYQLRERDVFNLAINAKGHTFLLFLVSFLVIERLNISVHQFYAARNDVNVMYSSARRLASKVAAYTRDEAGDKAQQYRNLIMRRLLVLLGSSTYIVQDKALSIAVIEGESVEGHKREHIKKRAPVHDDSLSSENDPLLRDKGLRHSVKTLLELKDPMILSINLHAAIVDHAKYLDKPMLIQHEMDLAQELNSYINAYHTLTQMSSAPFPFPLLQMSFTITDVWLHTLPFALASTIENGYVCALIVFFIHFGFAGINAVSNEIMHPTGADPNDFEIDSYRDVSKKF
mmetsp:Transcript_12265/g.13974  ORF Transcript_12265/g.13974 Transcript_12265/m.13974 type:complete len:324 (+) Transcript_12265:156-1127(+)